MNTTCKHAVCPATLSDTALCDCTLERIAKADQREKEAAPSLLEALQLLYDHSRLYMVLADNVIRDVEIALAKARGK